MKKIYNNNETLVKFNARTAEERNATRFELMEKNLTWHVTEVGGVSFRLCGECEYRPMATYDGSHEFYEVDGYVLDEDGKTCDDVRLIAIPVKRSMPGMPMKLRYAAVEECVYLANCYLIDMNGGKF